MPRKIVLGTDMYLDLLFAGLLPNTKAIQVREDQLNYCLPMSLETERAILGEINNLRNDDQAYADEAYELWKETAREIAKKYDCEIVNWARRYCNWTKTYNPNVRDWDSELDVPIESVIWQEAHDNTPLPEDIEED